MARMRHKLPIKTGVSAVAGGVDALCRNLVEFLEFCLVFLYTAGQYFHVLFQLYFIWGFCKGVIPPHTNDFYLKAAFFPGRFCHKTCLLPLGKQKRISARGE